MPSEMYELPEMVWVERPEKRFGAGGHATLFTCGPYRIYDWAHLSKWVVEGVRGCESFLLCCHTRAEAEAACAADRRERAAALGFVRVKEKL